MTNPAAPTPTPAGGGMPKWLIILLVVLLVIILGCCGGFVTCTYLLGRGAKTAAQKLQQDAEQFRAEAEKRAQEARDQAAANGATVPPAPDVPATPGAPAAAGATADNTPAAGSANNLAATKLPANFPSDIPVYSGLTPNYSTANKVDGTGSVVFTGSGDPDKIAAYYQKELENNGWTQKTNQTFNNSTVLKYTKDTSAATIAVVPNGNKVMVTIEYGKQ